MKIRKSFARQCVALCGVLSLAGTAVAGLKDDPEKGVDLTGTWQLDPSRSDDAAAIVSKARGESSDNGRHHDAESGSRGTSANGQPSTAETGTVVRAPRRRVLDDLTTNPQRLVFQSKDRNVRVYADKYSFECTAGVKEFISGAAGEGHRHCGWDGRAWVIETTGDYGFKREDRYELSKDGKTVNFLTTVSSSYASKFKISRTYTMAPAAATPSTPGA